MAPLSNSITCLLSAFILQATLALPVFSQIGRPAAESSEAGTQLGPVISLRYHSIDPEFHDEAEEVYAHLLAGFFAEELDGIDLLFLKGDRGAREHEYLEFWNFESLDARNDLFPTEAGPHPKWETVMDLWHEEHGGVWSDQVIGEVAFVGDFVLLGSDEGEFTAMPIVKLLGIHHVNVKPGSGERFEHYVTQRMNPFARSGNMWHLYFKGDRGEMKGKYIEVWAFDPASARDLYWPVPGEASEEGDKALAVYQKLFEGLQPMLADPAETEYSDWRVVR